MIAAFGKWAFNAWVTTIVCFGFLDLALRSGETDLLTEITSTVAIIGLFSPMYILPAAAGAVVMEWLWAKRVSRLLLGSIAGCLAMSWTLTPVMMLLAALAGGTAGWLGDRAIPLFRGRWFMAVGLGGLLMGLILLVPRAWL